MKKAPSKRMAEVANLQMFAVVQLKPRRKVVLRMASKITAEAFAKRWRQSCGPSIVCQEPFSAPPEKAVLEEAKREASRCDVYVVKSGKRRLVHTNLAGDIARRVRLAFNQESKELGDKSKMVLVRKAVTV